MIFDAAIYHEELRSRLVSHRGFIYISFNDFYGEETAVLFGADPMGRALRYESFIIAAMFGQVTTMYLAYKTRCLTELCVAGFVGFLIGVVGMATVQPGSGKIINCEHRVSFL